MLNVIKSVFVKYFIVLLYLFNILKKVLSLFIKKFEIKNGIVNFIE